MSKKRMAERCYHYKAEILKIIDGDTIRTRVKAGFYMLYEDNFRLFNYNAPEVRREERELGKIAKKKLEELLPIGTEVTMRTEKERPDKYGRWLAEIEWNSGSLNEYLVEQGYGVYYDGVGDRPGFDINKPYPLKTTK